ncbi:unnamed protein product [Caenorhabditis auriculariae]|uniref:Protein phosphatase 1 regulatory subunit 37 homolog n=1 Tax=Caenorhabditis auriculariae TaxID=2777116 RepID=A0A8S1H957_9PELO|nr:unnamed protein product [Caenorhabditis auriculariae]
MSMKFFSGLQDLLGLYEPGSSVTATSPAIPPTTSVFPPPQAHSSANSVRKKTPTEANAMLPESSSTERIRHCSHNRSVSFPDDGQLITGFSEAPISDFHSGSVAPNVDVTDVIDAYKNACQRLQCPPSAFVERQIGYFHKSSELRQECLSLKGERVSHSQMEALEEVFKRVQFNTIDFEYTFLDDDCALALGEMLEFYDSCVRLNLSFNKLIGVRGWNAIFRAVRNCSSLQVLNLRYTTMSEKALPSLCRTLRVTPCPSLTCLHLENTNITGKNLLILICALKSNTGLKELYLGDNGLQCTDGAHLFQLIVSNTSIQLLDLRNNQLGDGGVRHISDGLRNREALEKSSLSALVLWNNQVTGSSMNCLAEALKENTKIETLNIGNNHIGVLGVSHLKPALVSNTHLHRLGLQKTHIDCEGAIILAECLADNTAMVRVDIRDNPIELAGLLALHTAMKMNRSITLMNIDPNCVKVNSEKVRPYQDEFRKCYDEIQRFCDRNKEEALANMRVTIDDAVAAAEAAEASATSPNEDATSPECCAEDDDVLTPATANPTTATTCKAEECAEKDANGDCKCEEATTSIVVTLPPRDKPLVKKKHPRFARSSSLTCTETVPDLHDRLREMSGSTHSLDQPAPLDSASNLDSMRTIKKPPSTLAHPMLAEWGSLPALPQASPTTQPAVRKMRRFSVSPSSSIFDVSTTSSASIPPATITSSLHIAPLLGSSASAEASPVRPSSLAIGIPILGAVPAGPSSAPMCSTSLPDNVSLMTFIKAETPPPTPPHGCLEPLMRKISEEMTPQLVENDVQIVDAVRSVVTDLVNYVVYEETSAAERKASLLLQTTFQPLSPPRTASDDVIGDVSVQATVYRTPTTPSRMLIVAEELAEEPDEMVVSSVVRGLIRDVLQMEKEQLRSTLDRKRRARPTSSGSATPTSSCPKMITSPGIATPSLEETISTYFDTKSADVSTSSEDTISTYYDVATNLTSSETPTSSSSFPEPLAL